MPKTKKILLVLMAILLLVGVAACGNTGGSLSQKTSAEKTKTDQDAAQTEMEVLRELERLKSDPTYTLTEENMVGIWEAKIPSDTHIEYYYFTSNGQIYYIALPLADKKTPSQSTFTSEYRIGFSYKLTGYNKSAGLMKGTFYCEPASVTFDFTLEREANGNMTMVVSKAEGTYGTGSGTFKKTSIYVDGKAATGSGPKQKCEICSREGTSKYESFTGQTEYYCSQHYSELMKMLEAFGITK